MELVEYYYLGNFVMEECLEIVVGIIQNLGFSHLIRIALQINQTIFLDYLII